MFEISKKKNIYKANNMIILILTFIMLKSMYQKCFHINSLMECFFFKKKYLKLLEKYFF